MINLENEHSGIQDDLFKSRLIKSFISNHSAFIIHYTSFKNLAERYFAVTVETPVPPHRLARFLLRFQTAKIMTTASSLISYHTFSRWRDFCQVIAKTVTAGSPETAFGAGKLGTTPAEPFSLLPGDGPCQAPVNTSLYLQTV